MTLNGFDTSNVAMNKLQIVIAKQIFNSMDRIDFEITITQWRI